MIKKGNILKEWRREGRARGREREGSKEGREERWIDTELNRER